MFAYSWIQWLFFFFFYSFFGWCFESAVVSVQKKKPVNRGFIRGPFLPLYGSGAIMMLLVSRPFADNLFLTYVAGCIGATVLEYVTGVAMEALFQVRYWDYSNQKFNFQGQICLSSTLAWGGLTILMTHVVHRPVEKFAFWLPEGVLTAITMAVAVYFVADFALSFKAALDLRDILVRMEAARQEMERMQRRLDVILALADEAAENRRSKRALERAEALESIAQRRIELSESIEAKLEKAREILEHSDRLSGMREELTELRTKFRAQLEKREIKQFTEDFFKRNMLRGNPTMYSRKFAGALEELKKSAQEYRKKKQDEE